MPLNPINSLQASPAGEIDHNDVREKVNEIAAETNSQNNTLDHFVYNPSTDTLEADKTIQTNLSTFSLGGYLKLSSAGQDLNVAETYHNIDYVPVMMGYKDQSILANQDVTGYLQPQKRIPSDLTLLATAGDIITTDPYVVGNPASFIDYDGLTTLTSDLTTFGIRLRLGQALTQGDKLYYTLSYDDQGARTKIFTEVFTAAQNLAIGDYVEFWWSKPASAQQGEVVHAVLRTGPEDADPILQVYPNITNDRHWNEIEARTFTTSEIACYDDVKVHAWSYKDADYPSSSNKLFIAQNFPNAIDLFQTSNLEANTIASIESGGTFLIEQNDMIEVTASFKVDPFVSDNNFTLSIVSVDGGFVIRPAGASTSRVDSGQTLNFVFPVFKASAQHAISGIKLTLNGYNSSSNSEIYNIRTTIKKLGKSI